MFAKVFSNEDVAKALRDQKKLTLAEIASVSGLSEEVIMAL